VRIAAFVAVRKVADATDETLVDQVLKVSYSFMLSVRHLS